MKAELVISKQGFNKFQILLEAIYCLSKEGYRIQEITSIYASNYSAILVKKIIIIGITFYFQTIYLHTSGSEEAIFINNYAKTREKCQQQSNKIGLFLKSCGFVNDSQIVRPA